MTYIVHHVSVLSLFRASGLSAMEGVHYRGKEGEVVFEHGEDLKNIEMEIINDHATKKDINFQVMTLSIASCVGADVFVCR